MSIGTLSDRVGDDGKQIPVKSTGICVKKQVLSVGKRRINWVHWTHYY